jgi:hypothetical protein
MPLISQSDKRSFHYRSFTWWLLLCSVVFATACEGVVLDDTQDTSLPTALAENSRMSRRLVTVSTEAAFVASLANDAFIELASNLILASSISIDGFTGVVVNGSGYKLDGNDLVRCLSIQNNAEAAIFDLVITRGFSSTKGGGVQILAAAVATLTSVTISSSTAVNGGGLYIEASSTATLSLCNFTLNSAALGGGLCAEDSNVILSLTTFTSNSASSVSAFLAVAQYKSNSY